MGFCFCMTSQIPREFLNRKWILKASENYSTVFQGSEKEGLQKHSSDVPQHTSVMLCTSLGQMGM